MRRFLLCAAFLLVFIGTAFAALSFPALTGRVVDEAEILSATAKQDLEQTLADYEKESTNQVVVVTLSSLRGTTIEDYGYQLGRNWGIGQKDKNNGTLLIVAPKERKVRIEVGYGLEGVLTDALSSEIIQGVILPDFRTGQMEQGIISGTHAIIKVLQGKDLASGNDADVPPISSPTIHHNNPGDIASFVIFMFFYLIIFFLRFFRHGRYIYGPNGYVGGFSGGGFGGGGGFSGGGGGFGGGGASGGW